MHIYIYIYSEYIYILFFGVGEAVSRPCQAKRYARFLNALFARFVQTCVRGVRPLYCVKL